MLDSGQAKVGIVITEGTEAGLAEGRSVPVGIVVDGSDSKLAAVASGYSAQVISAFNQRRIENMGIDLAGPGVDARVRVLYNPTLSAVNTMIPGLLASVLMISMMSIMAQAVVRERERGTLEQMFVTPIGRGEYLIGKVIPYVIVAIAQMTLVTLVGRYWFGVPFNGQITVVATGLLLFMLTGIGLGLLVSLVSRTRQQAQQTVMFILIPTMVLSGFIFPIESMPKTIQPVTYLVPMRYALEVLRGSFVKGSGFSELAFPLVAMAVFSFVIFGIAVLRFSKRLQD
jgi:ABC-2 type transport system permease protein